MPLILAIIIIALGAIVIVSLGGGLVVLLAYGLGWLLTRLLPFTLFEATLLSLAGLSIAGVVAWRILTAVVTLPTSLGAEESDEEYDEEEWDEEAEEDEADASAPPRPDAQQGIPRWRQPLKKVDFSNAKPDDRCPCGSGRKYKNCHGRKAAT